MTFRLHLPRRVRTTGSLAQSLVEFAIILPLMVGIVAVLFQLGILFIA